MSVTVVVGCGWGDEGKGKVVDSLAAERHARLVIRFNGGPNAGHSVIPEVAPGTGEPPPWNGVLFRLHQVPSGVFTPGCTSLVGSGTVLDPDGFLEEMAELESHGVDTSRVLISDRAHLVLPMHRERDRLLEQTRRAHHPDLVQGTTLRGVGPAYEDKMARIGLRLGDLLEPDYLDEYVPFLAAEQSRRMQASGGDAVKPDELRALLDRWADQLRDRIVDCYPLVREAAQDGAAIILEGQLGACRDVDWGIYPDVTSSGTTAGAAAVGSGVPVRAIGEVLGVVKSFSTSVGGGPFVTELFGEEAERLRSAGEAETEHEYGATTGRARRCGWFDAVAARQAAALNGCTGIVLNKLDALDGFEEVQLAGAYTIDGETLDYVPSSTRRLARAKPVYEAHEGWWDTARGVQEWSRLPAAARNYAQRIETLVGVPVAYVGTGPGRLALARR